MKTAKVSIITPAFNAKNHISRSVKSVLSQTYENLEMLIIADDENDYRSILQEQGIEDERLRFFSTGNVGSGASSARNVGLDNANSNLIALLDCDDEFTEDRLEQTVEKIEQYSIVSTAIDVVTEDGEKLRDVGMNSDEKLLSLKEYCSVNFSTHNTLLFDKNKIPARYNEDMPSLNDYAFLISCFEYVDKIYHIPKATYRYFKQPGSISNSDDSQNKYIKYKTRIRELALEGKLSSKAEVNIAAAEFLKKSIDAEKLYSEQIDQDIIFENILEKLLLCE